MGRRLTFRTFRMIPWGGVGLGRGGDVGSNGDSSQNARLYSIDALSKR